MIIRFTRTIILSSGNEARNFRFHSLGYGRVQATYEYTDRRRAHQVARRYTVEFMNGRVESITARSARGGAGSSASPPPRSSPSSLRCSPNSSRPRRMSHSTAMLLLRSRRLKPNRTAPLSKTPIFWTPSRRWEAW